MIDDPLEDLRARVRDAQGPGLAVALAALSVRLTADGSWEEARTVAGEAAGLLGVPQNDLSLSKQALRETSLRLYESAVEAFPADSPEAPSVRSRLGAAYVGEYARTGDVDALRTAVALCQDALNEASDNHPFKHVVLANYATALLTRYRRTGDAAALADAVSQFRTASRIARYNGDPQLGRYRAGYGEALREESGRSGNLADANLAVHELRAALRATPPDALPQRADVLADLGEALRGRFAGWMDLTDLDEAVRYLRAADELIRDSPRPDVSTRLAAALLDRFEQCAEAADLDEAIRHYRDARDRTAPTDPTLPATLAGFATALRVRYEHTADVADLDQAVALFSQAVDLTPADHPQHGVRLLGHGAALLARYEDAAKVVDPDLLLTGAIHTLRTASRSNLTGANLATTVANLGEALRHRGIPRSAERELRLARVFHTQVAGAEHPRTLAVTNNLAAVLAEQNQFAEAGALLRDTEQRLTRTRDPRDADLRAVRANLAEVVARRADAPHVPEENRPWDSD